MLTKIQLHKIVDKLPEKFTLDEFIEELIFIEKVEKGLEQSEKGMVNSKEQAKQKLEKWLA